MDTEEGGELPVPAQDPVRQDHPQAIQHFISDACSQGLSNSVYQEEKDGTLVPVDHVDRALSITEQGWE